MKECLGGTAKVRWSEARTFFSVRSLSAEMKHGAVPLAITAKPSRFSVLRHWQKIPLASQNVEFTSSQDSSSFRVHSAWPGTEWHSLGSLRSWPMNSVKTRVQLRWTLAVWVGPGGTTVSRNVRSCTVLLRPTGKDLWNASQVPRYLLGSIEEAKEMGFTVPVVIGCWTYVNFCSLLSRYLKYGVNNTAFMLAAMQNT